MATQRQIEANRLNALKSTGPRTPEGKAASSMNALKSGIDACAQVIPGEDPEELAALARAYHERFRPSTPEENFLVDTLVDSEWLLRRYRRVEAQLWRYSMDRAPDPNPDCPLGQAFDFGGRAFARLQRRIDATRRDYGRALARLEAIPRDETPALFAPPVPVEAVAAPFPRQIGFVSRLSANAERAATCPDRAPRSTPPGCRQYPDAVPPCPALRA
jgi:hypothetical protein